jgi:hypothetical protein
VCHFCGHIHRLKDTIVSRGVHCVQLSANVVSDLRLFRIFLQQARDLISMNLLTYRTPDRDRRADACEKGNRRYGMATRKAWRWEIIQGHWVNFTLNSLEFIASFIDLLIGILDGTIQAGECVLREMDNMLTQ